MVGADRETCSRADAEALAKAADRCLVDRLTDAARRACEETIRGPKVAVVSGAGEFLARRVAASFLGKDGRIHSLGSLWGAGASEAACASRFGSSCFGGSACVLVMETNRSR